MEINGRTKVYGIIGFPVEYSLSPLMHNSAFAACGENRVYIPFQTQDLTAAIQGMKGLNIQGASVTHPHKEQVMELLDDIDPVARKIGSVNTVVVRETDGWVLLYGTNTDWIGTNRALADTIELTGSRAVILGAGGAAKAIGFGLQEHGVAVTIQSRTESRGRRLAEQLRCPWISLFAEPQESADILINATSVGMKPNSEVSPVDPAQLPGYEVVMDIVYAPLKTRLLREAEAAGCICINGLEMLLYQGVAQFELWTGREAPVEVMRTALHSAVDPS